MKSASAWRWERSRTAYTKRFRGKDCARRSPDWPRGLLASLVAMRALASLLYGVTATDPPTFLAVAALLPAISALSSAIPARRAARVDPLTALRHE